MADIQLSPDISPRVCFTSGGLVIKDEQILLIKHRKLGIWLAPGGHLEAGELPHQAALREVAEETGIQAEIDSAIQVPPGSDSEYQPVPLLINLHWVAPENYQARVASSDQTLAHQSEKWSRGCEQHLVWLYAMRIKHDSPTVTLNQAESTGIGWFSLSQIDTLATTEDVKTELRFALQWSRTK